MVDFVKLKSEDKAKKGKYFSFKRFFIFLLIFFFISSIITNITYSLSPKIAVIPIKGPIMTEKATTLYGTSISSREIANTLKEIEDDDSIKAVILDINSPGGSPVASEEISKAIESLKEKKLVYSLINDVGASGAFWVAVASDKIYASSMSTLGSIGVTSATLSFEDFIREHNITYRKQTAGEIKDLGTPFRKMTRKEERIIQNILDEIHEEFISHVAKSRNLSIETVEKYATGEIFLGTKAKEIGFIDKIGYYPNIIEDLKKEVGDNVIIVNYGPEPTLLEIIGLEALLNWNPSTSSNIMLK